MKLHNTILTFAALATAFVIPDERVMDQVAIESDNSADIFDHSSFKFPGGCHSKKNLGDLRDRFESVVEVSHDAFDNAVHSITNSFESATEHVDNVDFDHPPHGPPRGPKHPKDDPHHGPGKRPHKPHDPHHPHHPPHLTVYELINKSKYTTKFAKLVNEFDEIVKLLNSTKVNSTVFVPTDKAFEKIPDHGHKPSKEILAKVLAYHIASSLYPARRVFTAHTIPTLLNGTFLSEVPAKTPQRLAVKLGWTGLFIDGYSRVTYPNIFASNGVIHGIDSILIPPPSIAAIISHSPTAFSTLDLALLKSGLNPHKPHLGSTFFAPPNFAWAKLGPRINAFLFSDYGAKYLKAILKYHIVANQTLYSDAYYSPKEDEEGKKLPKGVFHVELPTLLGDRHLSVDIARYGRIISIKINAFSEVIYQDGVAKDGVIQTVNNVLIPPKKPGSETNGDEEEFTVESLKQRLAPYVENDGDDSEVLLDDDASVKEAATNWEL